MSTVPPPLAFLAQVRCEVGALVNLGAGPYGERRCVPLLGVAALIGASLAAAASAGRG